MKKIWVNKPKSFEEAQEFDKKYYENMTPQQRLSIIQELREMDFNFPKNRKRASIPHASRRRLQRVVKIVKQA